VLTHDFVQGSREKSRHGLLHRRLIGDDAGCCRLPAQRLATRGLVKNEGAQVEERSYYVSGFPTAGSAQCTRCAPDASGESREREIIATRLYDGRRILLVHARLQPVATCVDRAVGVVAHVSQHDRIGTIEQAADKALQSGDHEPPAYDRGYNRSESRAA
jgi:hypothetical protein